MPGQRRRRYVLRSAGAAAGSVLAAATIAAAAFVPAAEPGARLQGVHEDLARAVALQQVTAEQAERFEERLASRIRGAAGPL